MIQWFSNRQAIHLFSVRRRWIFFVMCLPSMGVFSSFAFGKTYHLSSKASAPSGKDASLPLLSAVQGRNLWGISYFSFFFGPGLAPHTFGFNPNQFGRQNNQEGVYFQNFVSFQWRGLSSLLALDLQTQFKIVLNNHTGQSHFQHFIWEAPRIGISGIFVHQPEWTLKGAINTNLPYWLPYPLSGYQSYKRTLILNPGLFAQLTYQPGGSRWSFFSVLTPRFFIYGNRQASEPQHRSAGYGGGNKPELSLAFSPTVNYRIGERTKLSLGSSVDYRKQVFSGWNPFQASLIANGPQKTWRLEPLPIIFGTTHTFSSQVTLFPFIGLYPIAAQRWDESRQRQASFLETASVGMWLSGHLL